ncbi:MAG: hypothetical protein JXN60_01230 [Lentisphaerae bacterium]|nr:hypothetical protein [Lentisphaerota bacterium]
MAQDWDIKTRCDVCQGCETPFQDMEPYFSALMRSEDGYVRRDYCAKCWESKNMDSVPYSSWQGTFRFPPPEPEEALKKETAESLLRKLMAEDDKTNINVMYILAVMLERKRMLIEKDVQTREDGIMIRVYEHRRTGETFLVPDPRLQLDKLEEVQNQVITLLGADNRNTAETKNDNETADSTLLTAAISNAGKTAQNPNVS